MKYKKKTIANKYIHKFIILFMATNTCTYTNTGKLIAAAKCIGLHKDTHTYTNTLAAIC